MPGTSEELRKLVQDLVTLSMVLRPTASVSPGKVKVKVAQSCPTLCNPMDYTVHGILQARILEWVAFPVSRGSSQPRDRTQVSHIAGGFFTRWATREAQGSPGNLMEKHNPRCHPRPNQNLLFNKMLRWLTCTFKCKMYSCKMMTCWLTTVSTH